MDIQYELIDVKLKLWYMVNKSSNNILRILGGLHDIILTNDFFSITGDNTELSFFISSDNSYFEELRREQIVNCYDEIYHVVKIYFDDTHGIDMQGIVTSVSEFFNSKNIPILYVNSFNNNYVLYSEKYHNSILEYFIRK